ncbi:MAG: HlyD family secretion protein [Massilia sp.]|nr:HlyD family secretion protein [Massilia sp.]
MKRRALLGTAALIPIAWLLFAAYGRASHPAQAKTVAVASAAVKRPLLLTGVVDAFDSQPILVPPSNSSPVVLRNFVEEGAVVKAGDVVLRIETQESSSVEQQRIDAEQAVARAGKDIAELEVKAVEAERALATARAALAKAKVDAALPRGQISGLDFDRYQGEHERATLDLEVKKKASTIAIEAVERRRQDADLESKKLQLGIAFNLARREQVQVRAARDGVVVHGYSEWRGERYDEGSSAYPGNTVGQVMGNGRMRVRAWALEADRGFIAEGQSMRLGFDALPGASLTGNIAAIANAPEPRASWGNGRYFRLDTDLPEGHTLPLVAGMSVLIEPQRDRVATRAPAHPPASASASAELLIEGEVDSRIVYPVSPPTIPEIWQYNLARLAPEGSKVKAGEPVATFGANDVEPRLETRRSGLKEKQSALARLKLEHAEGVRNFDLNVAEAQSNRDRARRKATQPKELIRRIDYDKLVIDRGLAEELAVLAVRERDARARARKAEAATVASEIAQHDRAIAELSKGKDRLTVKALHDGVVLYRTQFNGEKFAIGGQVWMGLSVATVADPTQLIVVAKVPEVQAANVQEGQAARVTFAGANTAFKAHVSKLGRTYHGKSRSQPIVVRDVELEFDSMPQGVKPGGAVQVSLLATTGKSP